MNLLVLFWRLLRYRVAVMLLLFMLLAAAIHRALDLDPLHLVLAGAALAFSYISATSSNDIADEKIDSINHPDSPGRPLIVGIAGKNDMWVIFSGASAAAIILCGLISWQAAVTICVSILINILYSLPPVRLSYRTFLAPVVLGIAYVGVPYVLALVTLKLPIAGKDFVWLAGLYLMFVGRIILKDFRDRKGDARYHKPTFLLRYGKEAACIFSFAGISTGGILLLFQIRQYPWLVALVMCYLASIVFMLWRLWKAPVGAEEQLSIGVGAKMGNGILITLLAFFTLREASAQAAPTVIVLAILASLFFANYIVFLRDPHKAAIGYKG